MRPTKPYVTVPRVMRRRQHYREVTVLPADDGAWYVHEGSSSGPIWLATFAIEDDARAYAQARAGLPWRVLQSGNGSPVDARARSK